MYCTACAKEIHEHLYEMRLRACPHCGADLSRTGVADPGAVQGVAKTSGARHYKLTFSGDAGEFFRIWIVNMFLSVVTFGIYFAWAKVRTRRYFYAHTGLAGHSFDYLAQPLAILKGNLVVGAGFGAYLLLQQLQPELAYAALGLYALIFPVLAFQTLRIPAHYSAYRGVRFPFLGTLGEAYRSYLFWPLAVPLTLGLAYPLVAFKQRRFYAANMAFGGTRNRFTGTSGTFYKIYGSALGIIALGAAGVFGAVFLFPSIAYAVNSAGGAQVPIIAVLVFAYLAVIVLGVLLQQFIYARVGNYTWAHSTLGQVRFTSTLRARDLLSIRLGNLLAILFSFGLLIPWARVRYTRYVLAHLSVTVEGDLDGFLAAKGQGQNALGDAAADLLEFDIGF